MSIVSRKGLTKFKSGKIGPISAPLNGRPLNGDTIWEGGPISASAIGRQDFNVDTAPEAARRREVKRYNVEGLRMEGEKEGGDTANEETLEEKINRGHEAWREGDDIIIEDEQGEVIETICSPKKHELQMVLDKFGKGAMERVGRTEDEAVEEVEGITSRLKRMWSGRKDSSDREKTTDLEYGIPESDHYGMSEKQRTSNESTKAAYKLSPPKAISGPVFMVDKDNRRMRRVSDITERRAREERDKETEVERRRREAVFGVSRDSDDDEPYHPPAISRNKGKQPESSPNEEADERESPDETSRSQSSSGRAESPGSGAQLLSPPPVRAREIRFGEINVGEESFSLEEGPPSTGAKHHKASSGDWRARWRSDNK